MKDKFYTLEPFPIVLQLLPNTEESHFSVYFFMYIVAFFCAIRVINNFFSLSFVLLSLIPFQYNFIGVILQIFFSI